MMAKYLPHFVNICTIHNVSEHCMLKYVSRISIYYRYYSSALLVPGSKRTQTFSFLTPYLDFDDKIKNMEKLTEELKYRTQELKANDVKNMWQFYKLVNTDKCRLEERSDEISKRMSKFFSKKELTEEEQAEFAKLKLQNKTVKTDLKSVKNIIDDLQESVLLKLLQLPNELDKRTPPQTPEVLKQGNVFNQQNGPKYPRSHIRIGKDLGLLEFKNPMLYFLCNEAALFELGVLSYAGVILSKSNLIRVAGSDFSRSVVVEGCGLNHEDSSDAFLIHNHSDVNEGSSNRMHLVGGASLISFLAMHTKQLINPRHLPIGYFSTGRQYTPYHPKTPSIGLFNVCQASAAVIFVLTQNFEEYNNQYNMLYNTVCSLYDNICGNYEVVIRPASHLKPWESMRVSFELWSTFLKQYVEVGHISLCGNYFSKRLLISYQTATGRDFPFVISGTVLSVPRLLGCLLEQSTEKFDIPAKIRKHMHDVL
ncbi:serine--tRNA synthetase-like protein Slimp [Megachile rotundata]|uniref:serine--tRNA synthetase-like protein Slimp n=1 Tax=Megachile rotundata TaxID=143995 RepID=UPI003FD3DF2C